MFDPNRFIHERAATLDVSGIRRVFDLAANLTDPINLSIGLPDFDVPQPIKDAAIDAIQQGKNRYTVTQGTRELQDRVQQQIVGEFPNWNLGKDGFNTLITSGVSGGLLLAIMATVGPGDEVLVPDPYFVMYKQLVELLGAKAVLVDTYPDFQLTPERIEPLITERTKLLLFSSPSNPTGVVLPDSLCQALVELADRHNLLLVSDEIYDEFCYEKENTGPSGESRCPSPATHSDRLLLLRGFSKSYAMTGWRLGYAAGPAEIIEQMTKLQQYTFVCAPSMAQFAGIAALDVDVSEHVSAYARKRDRVLETLGNAFEIAKPGGAFYAFPKVPEALNLTGTEFVERAIDRNLLIIPGSVFSSRDTHFRISYACDDETLDRGLNVLLDLANTT